MAHDTTRLGLLRWQLQLTWSLAEHHLARPTDAELHWAGGEGFADVRPDAAGRWWADWNDADPDDLPGVTAGWVTWHLGWWWTGLQAVLDGGRAPGPHELPWPGDAVATVAWLRELARGWAARLEHWTDADLEVPVAFPWPQARPLALAAAWANAELMKNVAELGQLLSLARAGRGLPGAPGPDKVG